MLVSDHVTTIKFRSSNVSEFKSDTQDPGRGETHSVVNTSTTGSAHLALPIEPNDAPGSNLDFERATV